MPSFYEALNVSSSAAEAELRSAYRRQALATHPDKGGTPEAFRLVVTAFETLTDPVRRAAYDLQLKHAAAPKERRVPTGPARPAGAATAKRASGETETGKRAPKKAKGEDGHATRSTPGGPSTGAGEPPEECKDNVGWVQELLGLSQAALRARLKAMTEEVLRRLLEFLQSSDQNTLATVVPSCSTGSAGNASSACSSSESEELSEEAAPAEPLLAICAVADDEDQEANEVNEGKEGNCDQQGSERKLLRGICRNKRDSSYQASVYFKGVGAYSQSTVDLNKIIDLHISLVRMRQRFYEHLASGRSCREALSDAVTEMHSNRAASQSPALRIRFCCRCTTNNSNRRLDLEELFPIWESELANKEKMQEERQQRRSQMQADRQAAKQEEEARKRQETAQRHQEQQERRQEKLRTAEERKLLREARRREREARAEQKMQRKAASKSRKLEFLHQEVQNMLQRLCMQRERVLQKAFGIKALPEGLVLGKAPGFQGAHVCAQLRLQNGSLCNGPLRKDLSLARSDFRELSVLQRKKGDQALQAELQRRELEAMTTFFMSAVAA